MKRFKIKCRGSKSRTAEVWLYDDIGDGWFGGISAQSFKDELQAVGNVDQITVYINSAGGSVFEGTSIYNQLVRHPAKVHVEVDGIAASIASLIAMAGDTISIAENAMMMVHKPYGGGFGTADDMRSVADTLDAIEGQLIDTYTARTGLERDEVAAMVAVETWMTAAEAVNLGFADEATAAKQMAAYVDLKKFGFKNAPKDLPGAVYTVKPAEGERPNRKKYAQLIEIQTAKIANK